MVKDLKAKIELLEDQLKGVNPSGPGASHISMAASQVHAGTSPRQSRVGFGSTIGTEVEPTGSDLSALTPAELRNRVRTVEMDRARIKTHVVSLKEKVASLEHDLRQREEDLDNLRAANEKLESVRSSVSRKDALIKSLREQVDKLQFENVDVDKQSKIQLLEAEKRIKSLQQSVHSLEKQLEEAKQELMFMRQRWTDKTAEELASLRPPPPPPYGEPPIQERSQRRVQEQQAQQRVGRGTSPIIGFTPALSSPSFSTSAASSAAYDNKKDLNIYLDTGGTGQHTRLTSASSSFDAASSSVPRNINFTRPTTASAAAAAAAPTPAQINKAATDLDNETTTSTIDDLNDIMLALGAGGPRYNSNLQAARETDVGVDPRSIRSLRLSGTDPVGPLFRPGGAGWGRRLR
jgi:myosin heavy subunit